MTDESVVVEGTQSTAPQSAVIEETSVLPPIVDDADKLWYDGDMGDGIELTDKDREFKSVGDYVKHTQSLRSMIGKQGISLPSEDATPEERTAFVDSLKEQGVDVSVAPDAYEVDLLANNEAINDERRDGIFSDFKEAKLTNAQANSVMDIFGKQIALDTEVAKTASVEQRAASIAEFKSEWGDGFKDRMAGVDRMAGEESEYMALMDAAGLSGNKLVMAHLDRMARDTAEDGIDIAAGDTKLDLDGQISKLKNDPNNKNLLRNGSLNDPLRIALMAQIDDMYTRKAQATT